MLRRSCCCYRATALRDHSPLRIATYLDQVPGDHNPVPNSYFSGQAACHCLKCHLSFADRPAYDAHRQAGTARLHPAVLGMELLGDRGWGWAARYAA